MDMHRVEFISNEDIEDKAQALLGAFLEKRGWTTIPTPVPIDDIIQSVLGVDFEIDDLRGLLGEGVLGATWMEGKGRIVVEQTLESDATGRFEFTQAHEVGHWVLHKPFYDAERMQMGLFDGVETSPAVVCRGIGISHATKARGEYQADLFAGALLMPCDLVGAAYRRAFGVGPLVLGTRECPLHRREMIQHTDARQAAKQVMEQGGFENVSIAAMIVRLNHLGYFRGEPETNRSLFERM